MRKFFSNAETIIAHNIQRADIPWFEKLLDIKLSCRIIDTLPLSWALFPELTGHGLYDWGERFGIPKIEITDWVNLPVEKYIQRCERDVQINLRLWEEIYNKLRKLYDNPEDMNRYIDYLSFKMRCARLKEQNRWKLDVPNAEKALAELISEREEKVSQLSRAMPKVPIYAKKSIPKRAYNKNGELTKLGQTWFDRLKELGLPDDTEEIEIITGYNDPNPASTSQIKDWLFSLGWEPSFYKPGKDKDGKDKFTPQVNVENKKGGGVHPCVKILFEKEPRLQALDGLSTLNARIPILSGLIQSVDENGLLQAQMAGLTNTLRLKHQTIVNLPKIDLPYALSLRGSLIARDGNILCGADLSNLEDRTKQHYLWPYDPEYVKSMMHPDWDAHLDIAVVAEMMTEEEANAYKKGDKSKKPVRDIAKNGNFAAVYGAGAKKLSLTMGIPLERAKTFKKAYEERNWAVKAVAEAQRYKQIGKEFWLFNPVSKFWYSLREIKDIFSTLNQSTGAYVFDCWLRYILEEDERFIACFHDELIFEIPDNEQEIKRLETIVRSSIQKVNDQLKLNREMDIDFKTGKRYSDIH